MLCNQAANLKWAVIGSVVPTYSIMTHVLVLLTTSMKIVHIKGTVGEGCLNYIAFKAIESTESFSPQLFVSVKDPFLWNILPR